MYANCGHTTLIALEPSPTWTVLNVPAAPLTPSFTDILLTVTLTCRLFKLKPRSFDSLFNHTGSITFRISPSYSNAHAPVHVLSPDHQSAIHLTVSIPASPQKYLE